MTGNWDIIFLIFLNIRQKDINPEEYRYLSWLSWRLLQKSHIKCSGKIHRKYRWNNIENSWINRANFTNSNKIVFRTFNIERQHFDLQQEVLMIKKFFFKSRQNVFRHNWQRKNDISFRSCCGTTFKAWNMYLKNK